MSSLTADHNQRDELPLLLAILLHLVFAGLLYWYATAQPDPPNIIRLEDLPLVIGQMTQPQQQDSDAEPTPSIAEAPKSEPAPVSPTDRQQAPATPPSQAPARQADPARTSDIASPSPRRPPDAERQQARPADIDPNTAAPAPTIAMPALRLIALEEREAVEPLPETRDPSPAVSARPAEPETAPAETATPAETSPPEPAEPAPAEPAAPQSQVALAEPLPQRQATEEAPEETAERPADTATPEQPREAQPADAAPSEASPTDSEPTEAAAPAAPSLAPPPLAASPEIPTRQARTADTAAQPPPAGEPQEARPADQAPPAASPEPQAPAQVQQPAAPAPLQPPAPARPAETATADAQPLEAESTTPRPRVRPSEPETAARPEPEQSAPPTAEAPETDQPAPETDNETATSSPPASSEAPANDQASALSRLGRLEGYSQQGSSLGRAGSTGQGVAGGSPDGAEGSLESFETTGSQLAQACLERAGAFRPTDHFTGSFPMRVNQSSQTVTIQGRPNMREGVVPQATFGKIESGLSKCPEFMRHLASRPDIREFNLNITTTGLGRRR